MLWWPISHRRFRIEWSELTVRQDNRALPAGVTGVSVETSANCAGVKRSPSPRVASTSSCAFSLALEMREKGCEP